MHLIRYRGTLMAAMVNKFDLGGESLRFGASQVNLHEPG